MDLKLKVVEGKNAGMEIPVHGKKFFIGRAEDCNLRPGSELISRHHCALLIEEGYLGVRDFGSKNGTYVNQERVVGERELKAGDRLTVGPLQFEVQIAHGLASKKRPPVSDVKEAAARTAHDAASAAHDPFDVNQWLSDESPAAPTGGPPRDTQPEGVSDTQSGGLGDTDQIPLSSTETMSPEAMAEALDTPHKKRTPGKLPPVANTTKDSQSAAAAMLNKLRKRR